MSKNQESQAIAMDAPVFYLVLPQRAARHFAALPGEAREVLRLCDGVRTYELICRDSPFPEIPTTRILSRLIGLGVVRPMTDFMFAPEPAPEWHDDQDQNVFDDQDQDVFDEAAAADDPLSVPIALDPLAGAVASFKVARVYAEELAYPSYSELSLSALIESNLPLPECLSPFRVLMPDEPAFDESIAVDDRTQLTAALPHFSDDDEEFFSSSLDHLVEAESDKYRW